MFNDQFDWWDKLQERKFKILLNFVESITERSCCNTCECIAWDVSGVLRTIEKLHDKTVEENKNE